MLEDKYYTKLTVLYVEDDLITRKLFTRILSNKFGKVITAENGLEALNYFKENHVDIILTDLAMPEMDGFKMIDKIREIDENVPIIAMTAYREESVNLKKANIVLFKPVNKKEVFSTVEELLEAK